MKTGLLLFLFFIATSTYAQPPYWGTIFMDADIITASDPSTIQSTTYAGRGMVFTFDRRVNNWVYINAYLFNVVWNDGLSSVAQVNPEFGSVAAASVEAQKYGFLIGQLPYVLRVDVDEIWIHKGTQPFGGGNNSILIHTGQSTVYENSGIIEETLVHEACHTSLDAAHAASSGWLAAQSQDNQFISNYAQSNPTSEDIAESYLTWLAVRYRQNRISMQDYYTILYTIPSRLSYFDAMNANMNPFVNPWNSFLSSTAPTFTTYPNPASSILQISGEPLNKEDVRLYNLAGQDFTPFISPKNNQINVSELPTGYYILRVKGVSKKIYKE